MKLTPLSERERFLPGEISRHSETHPATLRAKLERERLRASRSAFPARLAGAVSRHPRNGVEGAVERLIWTWSVGDLLAA